MILINDEEIIKTYKYNSQKGFNYLYEKYAPLLYTIALKTVNDSTTAEDILQETFENIYLSLDSFMGKSSLKTWIYKIFYRVLAKFVNLSKKISVSSFNDARNNPSSYSKYQTFHLQVEDKVIVENVLELLPLNDRLLLMMAYYEDLSCSEIAEITSSSINAVKVQLFRARQKFKSIYKNLTNTGT